MIQGPIFSPAESMTVEFQGLGSAPGPWYGPSPSSKSYKIKFQLNNRGQRIQIIYFERKT